MPCSWPVTAVSGSAPPSPGRGEGRWAQGSEPLLELWEEACARPAPLLHLHRLPSTSTTQGQGHHSPRGTFESGSGSQETQRGGTCTGTGRGLSQGPGRWAGSTCPLVPEGHRPGLGSRLGPPSQPPASLQGPACHTGASGRMRAPGPASPLYQTFGWSLFSCLSLVGGSAGVWKPEATRRGPTLRHPRPFATCLGVRAGWSVACRSVTTASPGLRTLVCKRDARQV